MTLSTTGHRSAALDKFLASRPGNGFQRAGIQAPAAPRLANAANGAMVVSSDRDGMLSLFAPILSSSGIPVNERTAMQVSTVYACLTKIAGAITQLPVHQYRVDDLGDRVRQQPDALWWLLNESPCANWTAASWKEWIVRCVCLRGDQFTQIMRGPSRAGGVPVGLRPLHPDRVLVRLVDSRLRYEVMDLDTGKMYGVDQDDMLHFAGFGYDGMRSISVIQYAARQAIGNSLAYADFAGRTVGEGAMPKVAISYPNTMDDDQQKLLRESFVATYGGSGGQKFPLVLTEGGTATQLSISPVDLQLMEGRKYERDDICQAFGVPGIIIGESEKTTTWGSGVEQIITGFVRLTIRPHLVRWTEELNRKLNRRAGKFLAFDLDELLAGDSKSQAAFFRAALGGPGIGDAWMSVDEVRRSKLMPPVPGGDTLYKAQASTPGKGNTQAADGPELDPNAPPAQPAQPGTGDTLTE
jgi:HK97 family phage portal protein